MSATGPLRTPTPRTTSTEELQPILMLLDGTDRRSLVLDHTPFRIGRKSDNDLVLPDTRVSRNHAEVVQENGAHFLVDLGSKHGTYVNGERVTGRQQLVRNDRIEIGARDGVILIFAPTKPHSSSREFLRQITQVPSNKTSDLEKLRVFLEAARKLNATSVLDDILATLVETSLRLTQAERGFVYLLGKEGELRMACAQNAKGEELLDDSSISRSVVKEAARSGGEFMVSDTFGHTAVGQRASVIANELRSMVCIPLRKLKSEDDDQRTPVLGVLYLDSKVVAHDMSTTSHDILRAIASEAASLLENAQLAQAEAAARRYQQELSIAAGFQQRLMSVRIPEVGWAQINARNLPCSEIGGDFYDVVHTPDGLALIVCDVCGKGMTAALLASILQGMLYSNLSAGMPLGDIVAHANRFLCQRDLSEKYATLVIVKLAADGRAEYVDCGQVSPLVIHGGKVARPDVANVPVGMMESARYETGTFRLAAGDRMLLVTDGVTEAEDQQFEFFGEERLEKLALEREPIEKIVAAIQEHREHRPLADDVTLLELEFTG